MKGLLKNIKNQISGKNQRNELPLPDKARHSRTTETFRKISSIQGWFTFDDCAHFSMALGMQKALGIKGDIAEVGCFYGRSTAVLGGFLQQGERLYVCDIFEGGDEDVYGKCPTPELVLSNILKANPGLSADSVTIIKGDSSKLKLSAGSSFRFVHVDGGHSYAEALSDLRVFADRVVDGGIMVVDDYMHADWPEVTKAADEFIKERGDFVPVADLNRAHAIGRKLYLMRRGAGRG